MFSNVFAISENAQKIMLNSVKPKKNFLKMNNNYSQLSVENEEKYPVDLAVF